jgi:hypothetical protein
MRIGTFVSFALFAVSAFGQSSNSHGGPPDLAFVNPPLVSPCAFPGNTADVKLRAALSALTNGGTVDARCFGATSQTIAAPVTIGDGSHRYSVVFDPSTTFVPGSTTTGLLNLRNLTHTTGFHALVQQNYAATAIAISDEIGTSGNFALDSISISGPVASHPTGAGTCLAVSASTGMNLAFAHFRGISCSYISTGISLTASDKGFINGNIFSDLFLVGCVQCIYTNASSRTAAVAGNTFAGFIIESLPWTTHPIYLSGYSYDNTFSAANVWDTVGKYDVYVHDNSSGNYFQGFFAKGFEDTAAGGPQNYFVDTYPNQAGSGKVMTRLGMIQAINPQRGPGNHISPIQGYCPNITSGQFCYMPFGNGVDYGEFDFFYHGPSDSANYMGLGIAAGPKLRVMADGSVGWGNGTTVTSSSSVPRVSQTQTTGQLVCIKSTNPTVLGTCTAVSGATCSACN